MSKLGDQPAFPTQVGKDSDFGYSIGGLTKREHFSAMVLQGLAANPHYSDALKDSKVPCQMYAAMSMMLADALLKALDGEE